MKMRAGNLGKSNMRVQSTPRGASRIAPPAGKEKRRVWRVPTINWRVTARCLLLVIAVAALGALWQSWDQLKPMLDRPIAQVLVESKLGKVEADNQLELQQQLERFGEIRFLTANLTAMQQALEQLPWVDQARISRVWPDQLKVEVIEQQPIARWGTEQWLNSRGQVFRGAAREPEAGMPQLSGPDQTEEQVMQQYWSLTRVLRPLGHSIARLELRARGSWFVTTNTGLELLLGRDEVLEKMRRFTSIYELELKPRISQVARVDLRYANGLAVAWRDQKNETAVQ